MEYIIIACRVLACADALHANAKLQFDNEVIREWIRMVDHSDQNGLEWLAIWSILIRMD